MSKSIILANKKATRVIGIITKRLNGVTDNHQSVRVELKSNIVTD
jgi:hypothetical protein